MIATVEGRLAGIEQDAVIVQVGGLGFRVHVPATFLRQCGAVGSSVSLHTYLHVREAELTLYGCATRDELQTFKLLLSVSGVGPKVGLAILSNLSLDNLHSAIANEQTSILSQVPGIGTKTAQKIILDLKDKVRAVPGVAPAPQITEQDAEIVAALVSLGYSVVEAQTALQNVPPTVQGIEERLRAALSYLGL
jgi:Holliday junction DNA helicase RuvA